MSLADIRIRRSFLYKELPGSYGIQLDFDNDFHCLVEVKDQDPVTLAEALYELAILVENSRDRISD